MSQTILSESEIFDLEGALTYQLGGIVSRTVLKQPSGSVTAFAFDAGQELSEHTCPHDALLHVVEGEGIVAIDGHCHKIAAGQMIRLPANIPHAVQALQQIKMLLTMLKARE